jgi:mitotic spindle assembly checkpoint protein MAD2B
MQAEIRKDDLVAVTLEFLEAAIHTVLKSRNVYSPHLFENRKLYGISVSQCRHPGVCSYIGTVLGNLKVSC